MACFSLLVIFCGYLKFLERAYSWARMDGPLFNSSTGMLSSPPGAACRFIWSQKDVYCRDSLSRSTVPRLWLCSKRNSTLHSTRFSRPRTRCVCSCLCAFIVWGMVQSLILPQLGILAQAFPPSRARSAAFATFSAGAPIGGAVGTQIGALLTQYTKYMFASHCCLALTPVSRRPSWRSPFYLIAGAACLCAIGGLFLIDPDVPSTEEDKRVDWLGAFLVTTGLVLLVFVLGQGSLASDGWKTGCKFLGTCPAQTHICIQRHHRPADCRRSFPCHVPPMATLSRKK